MATVTSFTSARMLAIENNTIVSGTVNGSGNLILTKHGGGTVNAGNVIGPTGTPGVSAAQLNLAFPVGMIIDYINATPPTGWLKMEGQVITGGQTTYPELWAKLPGSMKLAAPDITMPDTRGRVSVNLDTSDNKFDTIAELGGEEEHVLLSSEMPSHTHVQNAHTHTQVAHNHAQDPHTHTQVAHNHAQDYHDHGPGSFVAVSTTDDTHIHPGADNSYMFSYSKYLGPGSGHGGFATAAGSGYSLHSSTTTGEPIDALSRPTHTHAISGRVEGTIATNQAFTAVNNNTTATNQAFTAVNNNATAVNQNTGGGGAHNNLQPYVVFLKIIKATPAV